MISVYRPRGIDQAARAIAVWRYDLPYDFYDATGDSDDLVAELLDPQRRVSAYLSALDERDMLVAPSSRSREKAAARKS
jgi:hypothetical protein